VKNLFAWVLVAGALGTSGCADTGGQLVKTIDGTTMAITSAAVQRDLIYNNTLMNRDTEYALAFKDSGVTMEYAMVDVGDGRMAYLPSKISVRGMPEFKQNLESRPPDHRGWKSLDNFVEKGLYGWLGYLIGDFGKAAVSTAAPRYYGDYNQNSFNPITEIPYAPIEPVAH